MVLPTSGTLNRLRRARSVPLRIASGTSFALPKPMPTWPSSSPTTTSAEKLKRRPPLTTLATRLMWMTRSRSLSSSKLSNAICSSFGRASLGGAVRSEVQACFTRGFGEGLDAAVVQIPVAVEDHPVDFLLDADLGDECAHLLRRVRLVLGGLTLQVSRQGGRSCQGATRLVTDDLRVDVLGAAKHRQSRALLRAGDLVPNAELTTLSSSQLLGHSRYSSGITCDPCRSCQPCDESARRDGEYPCRRRAPAGADE